MKFGNTVRVGTSRYLTKIATLRRKADREQLWVLAAKHTASLQLLCTVGGSQARLDARTEFKISQRSPKGGGEAGREHHCRSSLFHHSLENSQVLDLGIAFSAASFI
jgi:hypothetical protein